MWPLTGFAAQKATVTLSVSLQILSDYSNVYPEGTATTYSSCVVFIGIRFVNKDVFGSTHQTNVVPAALTFNGAADLTPVTGFDSDSGSTAICKRTLKLSKGATATFRVRAGPNR